MGCSTVYFRLVVELSLLNLICAVGRNVLKTPVRNFAVLSEVIMRRTPGEIHRVLVYGEWIAQKRQGASDVLDSALVWRDHDPLVRQSWLIEKNNVRSNDYGASQVSLYGLECQ